MGIKEKKSLEYKCIYYILKNIKLFLLCFQDVGRKQ